MKSMFPSEPIVYQQKIMLVGDVSFSSSLSLIIVFCIVRSSGPMKKQNGEEEPIVKKPIEV